MEPHSNVIAPVQKWLEDVVIGLNLCPFASHEYWQKRIRFTVSEARNEETLLSHLYDEIRYLIDHDECSTSLLIHPNVLSEFAQYNQFLALADALLEQHNWLGVLQIASFHPQYQFADTLEEDAENYTNRSPYPMLHILRESMVTKAIERYPDIDLIPQRNIQTMQKTGADRLQIQLSAYLMERNNDKNDK